MTCWFVWKLVAFRRAESNHDNSMFVRQNIVYKVQCQSPSSTNKVPLTVHFEPSHIFLLKNVWWTGKTISLAWDKSTEFLFRLQHIISSRQKNYFVFDVNQNPLSFLDGDHWICDCIISNLANVSYFHSIDLFLHFNPLHHKSCALKMEFNRVSQSQGQSSRQVMVAILNQVCEMGKIYLFGKSENGI